MIQKCLLVILFLICFSETVAATEITGEITAIDNEQVSLRNGDSSYTFEIASGAVFSCNGSVAAASALIPVAENAFFEGKLILNDFGQVVRVDGCYIGFECQVESVSADEVVSLVLKAVEDNRLISTITPTEEFPGDYRTLYPGMGMFVLLDFNGGVRQIFK